MIAGALGIWAAALLVVGAFLMAGHLVPLPAPARASDRLAATLATRPVSKKGRWSTYHVLYEGCGCSSRVLDHLLDRGARPDLEETVLYAREGGGASPSESLTAAASSLRGAGFRFEALTPADLEARFQVESAPLLIVADARGTLRYAGGYTEQSGGKQIADVSIIDDLMDGRSVATRPVFGCAVSHRVQAAIDPLGLKYSGKTGP